MVGLITASNLKTARKTNTAKPAKSLVKFICYPEAHKFSTAATRWGCKHEGTTTSGCTVKAVLSLVTPFSEQYTCREIDNVPKPLPNNLFKEEFMLLDFMELLQQCQQILL